MEFLKAPWSWLHSQCGNAHPLLLLPPPSLSPKSVDHPETGSSLFVFLKKEPCCLSFPLKVNMHYSLPRLIHLQSLAFYSVRVITNTFTARCLSYIKSLQHAYVYKILVWTCLCLYKVRSYLIIGIIYL